MSSTTHTITLTAKDGTKTTFDAIERGAKADAKALQDLGRTGSAGLKQVDDAAKRTAGSTDDLNKRMAALGAVITGGAAILGQWSRDSQDADAIQRQLEASIAATGDSFDQYADRIQAAGERAVQLGQDDEAASQAISALTQITGDANVALDNMGLVMDLAAAKSMSLESAAELVGKVHEGNTAILQRYGIVVRDGATAEEALAQIQQQVAGQAEAHATTYARLREELSNLTDQIGAAAGEFAPMLALLPGVSSGLTLAGSAAGALAPNLTKGAVASKALSLAMGPAGIAVAAGAAAFGVYKLVDALTESYDETVAEAIKHTEDLTEAIKDLLAAGDPTGVVGKGQLLLLQSLQTELGLMDENIKAHESAIKTYQDEQVAMHGGQAAHDALLSSMQAELDALLQLRNAYGSEQEAIKAQGEAAAALALIYADTGVGAEKLQEDTAKLFATFAQDHDIKALFDGLVALAGQMGAYDEAATKAAGATDRQAEAAGHLTLNLGGLLLMQNAAAVQMGYLQREFGKTTTSISDFDEASRAAETTMGATIEAVNRWSAEQAEAAEKGEEAFDEWASGLEQSFGAAIGGVNQWSAETNAALEQAQQQAIATAQSLGVLDSFAEKLRPIDISVSGGDKVTGTAANAERAASAFETSTGVIIKQTDAISGNIEAVGKWAAAMLPAEEDLARLRDELNRGTISQDEYNEAVKDAMGSLEDLRNRGIISQDQFNQATKYAIQLTEDNARAQDSLAKIQARQVPFIEQQTEAYADQLAAIAAMPPEMARVTLGFMDATEAGKAQEAVMLAAAAAAGELGENGQAAATQIIEGAVAADPILGAMLESIGLVARDHEGNLVVNFPEGESLNELVKNLDQSIKTLTTALIILDGTSANPGVSVAGVVESLGDISSVSGALAALDGQSANTSINNVTTNVTNNITREIKEAAPFAHGGLVGAASGRMVRVNEGGQETATLPTGDTVWLEGGSMVWPHAASVARGEGRGGGGGGRPINFYGSVTIVANNPEQFYDQMNAYGMAGR